MEKVLIGKIVNVVGLKGEVKVYNYSDSTDLYENTESIYIDDRLLKVENVRTQKSTVILKLEDIDDRDAAERIRGSEVFVTEYDLPDLPEGEYYVRDLIGMDVMQEDYGHLGKITDVIQNTAQSIFEVETDDGKQVLIPHVPAFVININMNDRVVTVRLIEGMLDA